MMVSMEALAMAGDDYQEWGLSIDEYEYQESVVPSHLLAEEDCSEEDSEEEDHVNDDNRDFDGVEAKHHVTCDVRDSSVGKLIEQSISHIIVHLKHIKLLTHLLENFLFIHVLDFLL
ncbi:BnaA09g42710D [Brassica napus]|uniref:(rape) hypothetical protein n=1 Tax=Brassica napus TaxID=3708 RepID=A0A078FLG4_BRANA|nr:uncharacterized protein LOC106363712 [Brassica napus]CAF2049811.1 unnamed protein product [Brassica napus]CDY13769.1 BnaA09g42710D [Brassica napus]